MESTPSKNKQKCVYDTFVKNIAIILKKVNPYFNGQKKFIKKQSSTNNKVEDKNLQIRDDEIKLVQNKVNDNSNNNNIKQNNKCLESSNYTLKNKLKINKSNKKNDLLISILRKKNKKYLKFYYQKWNSISKTKNTFSYNSKHKTLEDKKGETKYFQNDKIITESNNKYNNTKTIFTSDLSKANKKANSANKTKFFPSIQLNNNIINQRYGFFENEISRPQIFFNSQNININNNSFYKSNINYKINDFTINNNINNVSSNNNMYENNNNYSNNYRIYYNNKKYYKPNSKSSQKNGVKTTVIQHYFGKTEQINEYNPSLINNKPLMHSYKYDQSNIFSYLSNPNRNYNDYYSNYNNRYKSIDESSRRNNSNPYQYYFSYFQYK